MLDIPTSFGPLGLTLETARDGGSAAIEIEPPRRDTPKRIKVHLEHFQPAKGGVEQTKIESRNNKFIITVNFK